MKKLLSTKQVSELLSIPAETLRWWRGAGIGPPFYKLVGSIRYDESDVEKWVAEGKHVPSVRAAVEERVGRL